MAEFYIDPSAPTNGTGTLQSPFNTLANPGGPNIYRFKRGTTFESELVVQQSGTLAQPLTFTDYGDPNLPKPLLYPKSSNSCIFAQDKSHIHIENLQMTLQTGVAIAVYMFAFNPGCLQNIHVKNCDFYECVGQAPTAHQGSAITVFTAHVSCDPISNFLVEDCTIDGCSSMGLALYGEVSNAIIRRTRFTDCARVFAGHGASHFAHRISPLGNTFTQHSGTIYRRAITQEQTEAAGIFGTVTEIKRVVRNGGTSRFELSNQGATSNPAVGKFGFTGGFLYVNFGEALGVDTGLNIFFTVCKGILHEDNVYEFTQNTGGVNGIANEGAGLQFDDGAEGIVRNCISRNNEGYGLVSNLGANVIYEGNIVENNLLGGILTSIGSGSKAYNNTVINNGPYGIRMWYRVPGQEIVNNIVAGNTIGIQGHADVFASHNCFFDNDTNWQDGVEPVNNIIGDPELDWARIPSVNSRVYLAGKALRLRRDMRGTLRKRPQPTIGAIEVPRYRVPRTIS
jgi:hypothetical protein